MNKPQQTTIELKELANGKFAQLTLPEKIAALHDMSGAEQFKRILADPDPAAFLQSLPLLALGRIVHDIGPDSSLIQLASPEQVRFLLDLELWEEWSISLDEMHKWLEVILESDSNIAVSILAQLDLEMLLIYLKKCMSVGGGLSDIINSEDFQGEWDHTFDEIFYLHFFDEDQSELILRMLELLYNEHHSLYRSLMLGVENDLITELEETAWQFRCGRLEDEGLPATATAATLFAGKVQK
jgi:hypothetical protein